MRLQSLLLMINSRVRLILIIAIAALAVESYASTVSVSTITFQSQYGLSFDVPSSFTALDQGLSDILLSQSASPQPCLWLNGTTCQTALTSPDLQYSLVLILDTPPLNLTTYTISAGWSQNGGPQTQMGTLTLSVSALASAGDKMTFNFDARTSSFTGPSSINLVVK